MDDAEYSNSVTCLLLAGDPAAERDWRAAAASLRLHPFVTQPIAKILAGEALLPSPGLVIIDLSGVADQDGDTLLYQVDRWCRDTRGAAIVSFGRADIDRVAAAVETDLVMLVCEPTQTDRIVALATALPSRTSHVAEIDSTANVLRLQQLADEVGRIARALAQSASETRGVEGSVSDAGLSYRVPPPVSAVASASVTAADIRAILRLRRQRDVLFGAELFADPAWDMILDLAAARLDQTEVAISSLCIAAAVPPTTALRWIRTLTELRILERRSDVRDGRRIFVALTDDAAAKIIGFLGRALATRHPPI